MCERGELGVALELPFGGEVDEGAGGAFVRVERGR